MRFSIGSKLQKAAYLAVGLALSPVAIAGPADNSFVWTSFTPPNIIDPYYSLDREINLIQAQLIWDGLVYQNPETGKFEPLLAKEWAWIDTTTLKFSLRDDVQWHNGDKFTADDVVATINYIANADNKIINQQNIDWLKSAEKIDDYTVVIHLKAPFEPALQYLSQLIPILPKDFYGSKKNAPLAERFVGTGPYRIDSFVPGSSVTLLPATTRLRNSPKGDPSFSKIVYRSLPDQSTQIAELLRGGVDWAWLLPPEQVQQLAQRSDLKVVNSTTMRITYLSYNLKETQSRNPLRDKRVREAITLAVNKDEIVKYVIGDGAAVANTPCHPSQFGCSQDVTKFSQNVARAKALLAEAGYPKGLTLDMAAYRNRAWAEALVSQLEEAGIKVNLQFGLASLVMQKTIDGSTNMVLSDFGSYAIRDTSAIMNNYFTGGVQDWTKDKELSDILVKARGSLDLDERKDLYKIAINKVINNFYWTPLWYNPLSYVFSPKLSFKPYTDENPRFFLAHWNEK